MKLKIILIVALLTINLQYYAQTLVLDSVSSSLDNCDADIVFNYSGSGTTGTCKLYKAANATGTPVGSITFDFDNTATPKTCTLSADDAQNLDTNSNYSFKYDDSTDANDAELLDQSIATCPTLTLAAGSILNNCNSDIVLNYSGSDTTGTCKLYNAATATGSEESVTFTFNSSSSPKTCTLDATDAHALMANTAYSFKFEGIQSAELVNQSITACPFATLTLAAGSTLNNCNSDIVFNYSGSDTTGTCKLYKAATATGSEQSVTFTFDGSSSPKTCTLDATDANTLMANTAYSFKFEGNDNAELVNIIIKDCSAPTLTLATGSTLNNCNADIVFNYSGSDTTGTCKLYKAATATGSEQSVTFTFDGTSATKTCTLAGASANTLAAYSAYSIKFESTNDAELINQIFMSCPATLTLATGSTLNNCNDDIVFNYQGSDTSGTCELYDGAMASGIPKSVTFDFTYDGISATKICTLAGASANTLTASVYSIKFDGTDDAELINQNFLDCPTNSNNGNGNGNGNDTVSNTCIIGFAYALFAILSLFL